MPDDPKKPPGVPTIRITETSRAVQHRDHRRQPEPEAATPVFVPEEVTGNYEGDELKKMRARRPTDERLTRLEDKHDVLDAKVDGIAVDVAGMKGQFTVIPRLVDTMEKAIEHLQQRDHVRFTASVDVDKAKELSKVEIEALEKRDEVDADKAKRTWISKTLAIVSSIVATIATVVAAGRC